MVAAITTLRGNGPDCGKAMKCIPNQLQNNAKYTIVSEEHPTVRLGIVRVTAYAICKTTVLIIKLDASSLWNSKSTVLFKLRLVP